MKMQAKNINKNNMMKIKMQDIHETSFLAKNLTIVEAW